MEFSLQRSHHPSFDLVESFRLRIRLVMDVGGGLVQGYTDADTSDAPRS